MNGKPKSSLRQDRPGHFAASYRGGLVQQSPRRREQDDRAFLVASAGGEELSGELGESFLEAATSGADSVRERLERVQLEESGGPFVVSRKKIEMARGVDESNPRDAMREPIPTANATAQEEDEEEDV